MLGCILKRFKFTEQQIRDIVKRDLPSHHLKKRPTQKKAMGPIMTAMEMNRSQLKEE